MGNEETFEAILSKTDRKLKRSDIQCHTKVGLHIVNERRRENLIGQR